MVSVIRAYLENVFRQYLSDTVVLKEQDVLKQELQELGLWKNK